MAKFPESVAQEADTRTLHTLHVLHPRLTIEETMKYRALSGDIVWEGDVWLAKPVSWLVRLVSSATGTPAHAMALVLDVKSLNSMTLCWAAGIMHHTSSEKTGRKNVTNASNAPFLPPPAGRYS